MPDNYNNAALVNNASKNRLNNIDSMQHELHKHTHGTSSHTEGLRHTESANAKILENDSVYSLSAHSLLVSDTISEREANLLNAYKAVFTKCQEVDVDLLRGTGSVAPATLKNGKADLMQCLDNLVLLAANNQIDVDACSPSSDTGRQYSDTQSSLQGVLAGLAHAIHAVNQSCRAYQESRLAKLAQLEAAFQNSAGVSTNLNCVVNTAASKDVNTVATTVNNKADIENQNLASLINSLESLEQSKRDTLNALAVVSNGQQYQQDAVIVDKYHGDPSKYVLVALLIASVKVMEVNYESANTESKMGAAMSKALDMLGDLEAFLSRINSLYQQVIDKYRTDDPTKHTASTVTWGEHTPIDMIAVLNEIGGIFNDGNHGSSATIFFTADQVPASLREFAGNSSAYHPSNTFGFSQIEITSMIRVISQKLAAALPQVSASGDGDMFDTFASGSNDSVVIGSFIDYCGTKSKNINDLLTNISSQVSLFQNAGDTMDKSFATMLELFGQAISKMS